MPPKGKKTKAEEAMDFLSNLDNLDDAPGSGGGGGGADASKSRSSTDQAQPKSNVPTGSGSTPRQSTDSARPARTDTPGASESRKSGEVKSDPAEDDEAAKALAFLEAQINTKRQPLTVPQSSTSRPTTPSLTGKKAEEASASASAQPANVPSSSAEQGAAAAAGSGWGSSWWSTATSAIQSAQKIADEQYKKVKSEGVGGVTGQLEHLNVKGVDLAKLRKEAEERFGGIVKNVDLERLRQELYNNTSSAFTNIINTVAPPISAHETLELWLSHPMTGYGGVEGVVYRAWMSILEQTESGELVVVWSPPESAKDKKDRGINPVQGFDEGWKVAQSEVDGVKQREEKDPKGRKQNGNIPVTTIPIFLHLQPILAPLPIPEPTLLLDSTEKTSDPPKHLHFVLTLHDTTHNLRFSTVSQPVPGDWLDVEYDQSEWVEERLVDVIRIGVEIIAQDYVATRMALKPSAKTQPATPKPEPETKVEALPTNETEEKKDD